eukprot:47935-Chlamydomonas_euryale.AAC.1
MTVIPCFKPPYLLSQANHQGHSDKVHLTMLYWHMPSRPNTHRVAAINTESHQRTLSRRIKH